MKKLLLLGAGSALIFTMGGVGPALADAGPHISGAAVGTGGLQTVSDGAGKCAACHRAHTAQAAFLLVQAQPALCYTCHDGTGVADTNIKDGTDPQGGALRGGGFETAAINSGGANSTWVGGSRTLPNVPVLKNTLGAAAPIAVTSKHQIGTEGTAWGNGTTATGGLGATITLECTSCHDPHGNGNFRILKSQPTGSGVEGVTFKAAVPATALINNADGTITPATPGSAQRDAVTDTRPSPVNIPDAVGGKTYTTTNYWLTGDSTVPLNATPFTGAPSTGAAAPDGYIQNIAAWCTTCHTRYLAPTGSYKTPTTDTKFMYRHRSDANYKQGAANCITCHVSHGSNAAMNGANFGGANFVADPAGNVPNSANNSRLLRVNNRGTCEMCHNV